MSRVTQILSVFTKTIAKLEELARVNRREAGVKTAQADVLDTQAAELLKEATEAEQAAGRLKTLLEEPK